MVCSNCGKKHSGGLCPWCGHVAEAPKPTEAQLESLWRRSDTRHGVPALLSFFVPGLGQLIKGNVGTALTVWLGLGIFIGVGMAGLWLTFLGIPILWIWSLYDAYVAPDGPTRREMDRLAKTLVLVAACALVGTGCGSVTVKSTDDGGTGGGIGTGGKIGVESDAGGAGGSSSATGGAGSETGGIGGAPLGTGGAQATGGVGGVSATGGTGGISCGVGFSLCKGSCTDIATTANCGSCGNSCAAGQSCANGICAETCDAWGWTPTGCTSCSAGTKAGKPCSVCSNEPTWFTGSSSCQNGSFLVAASCSACAAL